MEYLTHLWFLWSVFCCSLITAIIFKLKINNIFIYLFAGVSILSLIHNSDLNIYMFPFFIVGFYYKKYQNNAYIIIYKLRYLINLIFIVMLFHFEKKHYIYISGINIFKSYYGIQNQIYINIYRYIIDFCGCFAIINISKYVYNKFKDTKFISLIINIGKNTLQIYVLQRFIVEIIGVKVYRKLVGFLNVNYLTFDVVIFDWIICPLIAIILCYCINIIIEKTKRYIIINKIIWGR